MSIIDDCHAIRRKIDKVANSPVSPTITYTECVEDTLLHALVLFNRKPSKHFNATLQAHIKRLNSEESCPH
jgi:hypothetical protein